MAEQKSLILEIAETIDRRLRRRSPRDEEPIAGRRGWRWLGRQMIPNIGTVLAVVILLLAVPSLAAPLQAPSATSTSTISYQGRLADSAGNPLTDKYNMEFRVYDVPTGGTPLWTEMWTGGNAVDVSDGLFNVMLGSIDNTLAASIEGHDELYLGITVGTDSEMVPRVQLGSVPFSMQAMTVPDGSITSAKLNLTSGLNVTGTLAVDGAAQAHRVISLDSIDTNSDLAAGNMGRNTWVITTTGSILENWHVEETWMHFGGDLFFVRWTLGIDNQHASDLISVPANSFVDIPLTNWDTQEFASSRFADMRARSYLTGLSPRQNLINLTHYPSDPTLVDFVVYNGVGAVSGAVLSFSNPSSTSATVRSFSVQGFVSMP